MIKLLHIINSFDIGGNEIFVIQLLERLDRTQFIQHLCIPDRGKDRTRTLETICRQLEIDLHVIPVGGNLDFRVLGKLKNLIARNRFDIVHTHLPYSQIWGRIAAKRAGARAIISSEQGLYDFKARFPYRQIERRLSRYTDRIITCSERIRTFLIEDAGIDSDKVTAVHNSADTAAFHPPTSAEEKNASLELRKKYSIEPDDFVVGTVGNIRPVKGQTYLVESAIKVVEKLPRTRFVIVGGGPEKENLEKHVQQIGLSNFVIFTGVQKEIPPFLNMFDLFVLPSVMEGFGIAIVEAMACGIPVLATEVGGIPEIIQHGENGLLVPSRDSESLANAIIQAASNRDKLSRIAAAGISTAREKFDVSSMVEKICKIYLEVLENKPQGLSRND